MRYQFFTLINPELCIELSLPFMKHIVFREECLAPFGRLINYGNASGQPTMLDTWQLTVPNQSVSGFYIGGYFGQPQLIQEACGALFAGAASGQLKVHVGQALPLAQAADAHRLLKGRQTTGKVVLLP